MGEHKGWYSRQNLPHFDASEVTQFVTFRLADSLPREFLVQLEEELKGLKAGIEIERIRRIEKHLD